MSVQSYATTMQKMFAAVSDLYAEYWGDFFHFAIFDDGETREQALQNTHRAYMDALRIGDAHDILDLACGRGGFARLLAQNTSGNVLGIDISESQLSHARRLVEPNLTFEQHDIMQIDTLGMTFDALSFLDAACYLPDKELALRNIRRVMRPGARLLILEWCKKERLSAAQEELVLHPFMKYWAVPNLETSRRYEACFRRNGYKLLDVQDLNSKVARNWELGYQNALRAVTELSARDAPRLLWKGMKLGPEGIRLIKGQFPASVYIKVGFDTGFLRYMYFLVESS